ncbi:hypothetical protein SAMN05518801_12122 [Novosphingobium sp. CF614]|uniref:hypothetical protein n=1 Tax=Novosphingobium sp. CF614 TaxID=1884364 RepID=UPI0008E27C01|nr:hypothetical protein [Novosphingobium sp. CF614]SFG38531.1 hypothetical protein SAMN05518801_12122 [Novosphingobium sp. CF614]
MLAPIAALLITYALTALVSTLAAVVLWRPLSILLAELCGTEERSRFWTVWSTVMTVVTPMLFVSLRSVANNVPDLVQSTMTSTLFGILLALVGMGYAVWSRSPVRDA